LRKLIPFQGMEFVTVSYLSFHLRYVALDAFIIDQCYYIIVPDIW